MNPEPSRVAGFLQLVGDQKAVWSGQVEIHLYNKGG